MRVEQSFRGGMVRKNSIELSSRRFSQMNADRIRVHLRKSAADLKRRQAKRAIELAVEFVVLAQAHFHDAGQFFEVGEVHDCVDVV